MTKHTLRTIALSLALATGSAGVFQAVHAQPANDNSTQAEQKAPTSTATPSRDATGRCTAPLSFPAARRPSPCWGG